MHYYFIINNINKNEGFLPKCSNSNHVEGDFYMGVIMISIVFKYGFWHDIFNWKYLSNPMISFLFSLMVGTLGILFKVLALHMVYKFLLNIMMGGVCKI